VAIGLIALDQNKAKKLRRKNSGKKLFAYATAFLTGLLLLTGPALAHLINDPSMMAVYIEAYRKLVKENPDDFELRYQFASMLILDHQFKESEKQMNYVIEKNPNHDMAYILLAANYCHQKKYKKALKQLSKIKKAKMNADRLIAEASIYIQLKNPKKAMKLARKAIKLDKLNPSGYLQAGLAYRDLGEINQAVNYIQKSFVMNPYQPLAYGLLKVLLGQLLSPKEQLERLQELKKEISFAPVLVEQISQDIAAIEQKLEEQKK
jgi:tetratricopeptide (TPR) repeat protein